MPHARVILDPRTLAAKNTMWVKGNGCGDIDEILTLMHLKISILTHADKGFRSWLECGLALRRGLREPCAMSAPINPCELAPLPDNVDQITPNCPRLRSWWMKTRAAWCGYECPFRHLRIQRSTYRASILNLEMKIFICFLSKRDYLHSFTANSDW